MDPSQLPPLRSGIGQGTDDALASDVQGTQRRLVAAVAVMTRTAGIAAYRWAVHHSRSVVIAEDVNKALMYQARHFLSTIDHPDVVGKILKMEASIFDTASSGDEEDEEDEESEDEESGDEIPTEEEMRKEKNVVNGLCVCTECVAIREAVNTWDSWNPEDEAEKYLQQSVNRAIESASRRRTAAASNNAI